MGKRGWRRDQEIFQRKAARRAEREHNFDMDKKRQLRARIFENYLRVRLR